MKKVFLLLFILMSFTTFSQVNVVGYIQTNGVANYPTHIDSMGKGGYMVVKDTNQRNSIPCLRRKYGMAVYSQEQNILYILKDSNCNNIWTQFTSGNGSSTNGIGTFGSFYDSTTQTILNSTTANIVKITKTDTAIGFHIVSNRIISDSNGVFNLQWSGQFQNTDNAENDVSVWIRKNGVNVVGSTGYISVPKTRASIYGHTIASWNYIIALSAGDSITFYWQATSNLVTLQHYPQQTSPTRPSTASAIVTITPAFSGTVTTGGGGSASQTLQQILDYNHSLLNGVNTQGTQAGAYSSGTDVNAFGTQAAYVNYGNSVNAIGSGSANGNLGTNVNAFGNTAGLDNKFSNVTLFGEKASADSTNQMVFSLMKEGDNVNKNARIDFNCITNDRKYILPDLNGYMNVTSYPNVISADTLSSPYYNVNIGGVYKFINVDPTYPVFIAFPNANDSCNIGNKITIINSSVKSLGFDVFPKYQGSSMNYKKINANEIVEFISDGYGWRAMPYSHEPFEDIDGALSTDNYRITVNGTYYFTNSNSNIIEFPPACNFDGEKITLINDGGYTTSIASNTDADCSASNIIGADGNVVTTIDANRIAIFTSVGTHWVVFSSK